MHRGAEGSRGSERGQRCWWCQRRNLGALRGSRGSEGSEKPLSGEVSEGSEEEGSRGVRGGQCRTDLTPLTLRGVNGCKGGRRESKGSFEGVRRVNGVKLTPIGVSIDTFAQGSMSLLERCALGEASHSPLCHAQQQCLNNNNNTITTQPHCTPAELAPTTRSHGVVDLEVLAVALASHAALGARVLDCNLEPEQGGDAHAKRALQRRSRRRA